MVRLVLETTYDPPFTETDWDSANQRLFPCLELHNVRWIRSLVSGDRTRSICEFEAPDAESVRQSYRQAQVPFGRIWAAELQEP
ncbi:hypothetical protein XM38_010590 [Halomicronema hongdechloris C2206]|uniref:DUF4242 domain-containing protein n=1 Tax=Halomicronema hongdechloris C2206 TaxID=1641165 RepID=A0A1Z3HII1_9CYAN|nr:DUF4242 domain-containing protein [Halomicronema hongdechloris]ASC70129.1 hypothetical protein XM38_010590 [Halomicronema hongdechloris C2206]